MERLTGQDAAFLYNETPSQHMHTLKIAILDASTGATDYSFERFAEELRQRLHLLPPMRRRVVFPPFQLHHPWWIEDPDFKLENHLRRAQLPAPGGRDQLDTLISEVASRPLDRRRPLWEIWMVEGLDGERVAFVAKIHHAVADGVMAAYLLANVFEPEPDRSGTDTGEEGNDTAVPPAEPWRPDPIPSSLLLLKLAVIDIWRLVLGFPALAGRTLRGQLAVRRRRRSGAIGPPAPFSGPKLSFNRALTPHRIFVSAALSLNDARTVKSAYGVTVNDVVLAICAGGLRTYLDERGELPHKPLVAAVPISTRPKTSPVRANSASTLFTTLPVEMDDPVERLRIIHDVTSGSKEQFALLGPEMLEEWSEFTPPLPYSALMRLISRTRLADRFRPAINLVVSNVPGPPQSLQVAGARLDSILSMGPILEGVGLNITVWSYLDQLNFGLVAVPEQLPDLRRLADMLGGALEELKKAAPPTGRNTSPS
jgi:diacylglycerol O-acyltransferase